jgi:four helix bundle protein
MEYDLEERTMVFAKNVLGAIKTIKENGLNRSITNQLIRSATSVGANYCEANGASSKKDFRNKIYICKKEIKESKYWIEMLAEIESEKKDSLRKLWKEAHELTLIFGKIASSLRN